VEARRCRDTQPRLLRCVAPARCRIRRAGLPRGTAGRVLGNNDTPTRSRGVDTGELRHRRRSDAYAEGLQFNAIKIEDGGRRNDVVWQILRDNCRAPQLVVGDMEAQVAACKIGAGRFLDLLERYGLDTVQNACEDLMDYSDRMLRREIEKLPDGVYAAEGRLDGFVSHPDERYENLTIKVTLTVAGSELTVDLTGTDRQVDLPINMPLVGTVDIAIWVTLRSILLDAWTHDPLPTNSGLFRAVKIIAPEGEGFQFSGSAVEHGLVWVGRIPGWLFDSSISRSARLYACSPVAAMSSSATSSCWLCGMRSRCSVAVRRGPGCAGQTERSSRRSLGCSRQSAVLA
jgi:hypothetical protein